MAIYQFQDNRFVLFWCFFKYIISIQIYIYIINVHKINNLVDLQQKYICVTGYAEGPPTY